MKITESGTALVIAIGTGVTETVTEIVTGTVTTGMTGTEMTVTAGMTGVMIGTEMIVTGGVTIVTDLRGTETKGKWRREAILTSRQRTLTMTRNNRRASATRTR